MSTLIEEEQAEHNRLIVVVEQLQQAGLSDRAINAEIRRMTRSPRRGLTSRLRVFRGHVFA